MLETANEAYKVLQMNRQSWPAAQAFYQMTLGKARALGLETRIGALREGMEADVIVLDSRATPAMAHRMESIHGDIEEELFLLMIAGDDRAIAQTYIAGAAAKTGLEREEMGPA
jgi:guanine deaminase